MHCPKCRIVMDKVEVDGVEVDRCQICKGLWFDTGEADALRDAKAAKVIDTGNAWEGSQLDFIDRYRCPRCGGVMSRSADTKQKHIHFETCADCQGSFFDAGEFRQLSKRSLTSLVRRLVTRNRG